MVKNDAFALNVDGSIGGIERLLWTAQAARIKDVQPVPIRIIRLMGVTVQQTISIFAARLINQHYNAVCHIPQENVNAEKQNNKPKQTALPGCTSQSTGVRVRSKT